MIDQQKFNFEEVLKRLINRESKSNNDNVEDQPGSDNMSNDEDLDEEGNYDENEEDA